MSVTVAVHNSCTSTGEGPYWDDSSQTLLYVDIEAGDIHRYNPTTNTDTKIHFDGTLSLVVPRRSGGYMVGLGRSLSLIDWHSGQVTKQYAAVNSGANIRFNDGKCDAAGRLWAGTMGMDPMRVEAERKIGSLYSLENDGSLREQLTKTDIANGMAWTADNQIMYYTDSTTRKVFAYDYDLIKGELSNERVVVDLGLDTEETMGFPDGMCIDTEDNIWLACYGVGKVFRFDPQTGALLQTVKFPARYTTSCCFGGKNLDELYVTTAKTGVFEETSPVAGSVFRVTGLGCKGTVAMQYGG